MTPRYHDSDDDVGTITWDYTDRSDGDYLVSGPLGAGIGRGRHFKTIEDATRWAVEKFGARLRRRAPEAEMDGFRWAFIVRKAKDAG